MIDDEPQIQKAVCSRLEREGYRIEVAGDGEEALEKFAAFVPDLVVLDLMLPGRDGFDICSWIRQQGTTPIIILSARGDELDKMAGFHLGADDYITKPFSLSELALRVAAVLRRSGSSGDGDEERPAVVHHGQLVVDRKRRSVTLGGRPLNLTAREFDLLWLLSRQPGIVFSRDQILEQIWHSDYPGDVANVTVMVSRLREKLMSGASQGYIETVRGVGYRFNAHPSGNGDTPAAV